MRYIHLLAAILLASIAAGAVWWFADRPVPVAAEWNQPLSSISFAAYRRGESPISMVYPTAAEVEQDVLSLIGKTRNIRTYTTHEGLEVLPPLAQKYGLKMTMGCWLGRDMANNEREVSALIEAANAYPDTVTRVIVGNEVMLRGDLTPAELVGYIHRVKAAIKQPVSTADVFAFVLKNPEVVHELDYITVHILPFWDDYPIGMDGIEEDAVNKIEKIRSVYPAKPIMIGEVGWPSLGRDRGPASVNLVNEADFLRRIANLAGRYDFDYNIIEAFDQPWKSQLENTVGANWGVMEADRVNGRGVPKFAMTGPVTEVADWPVRAGWSIGFGIVATLLLARSLPSFSAMLIFAAAAQILSWLLITTGFHTQAITYRAWQQYWLVLRVGLPALLFLALLMRIRDRLCGLTPRHIWCSRLMEISAAYAIGWSVLLLADGYYRDIPEFDFCLAVGGVLVLAAVDRSFTGLLPRRRLLGWGLVAGALFSALSEAWALHIGRDFVAVHPLFSDQLPYLIKGLVWNREMDLWSAMQLLWAVPFLLARKPEAPIGPA